VVNYFLGGLGAFLGPLFGIMIVDYFLVKRGKVDVAGLFNPAKDSPYHYRGGVNPRAIGVFVPTAALTAVIALVPIFGPASPYSWFIGTAVSAVAYFAVNKRQTA
jgi:NCS1 family nucleobase:cation symporter-1